MPEPTQIAVKLARKTHEQYCQHLALVECEQTVTRLAKVIDEAQKAERERILGRIRKWAAKNILWFMAGGQTELLAQLDEIEKEGTQP